MPVLRYFMYVGGTLLALLFVIDSLVPKQVAVASNDAAAVERPTVRIRSDQKLPERVVYDTSIPTLVPAKTQVATAEPAAPASEMSAQARVRDTFALFVPQPEPKKAAAVRHEVKSEPQVAVVPQKMAAQTPKKPKSAGKLNPAPASSSPTHLVQQQQPPIRVAQQQPHFGLFGAPLWRTTW